MSEQNIDKKNLNADTGAELTELCFLCNRPKKKPDVAVETEGVAIDMELCDECLKEHKDNVIVCEADAEDDDLLSGKYMAIPISEFEAFLRHVAPSEDVEDVIKAIRKEHVVTLSHVVFRDIETKGLPVFNEGTSDEQGV